MTSRLFELCSIALLSLQASAGANSKPVEVLLPIATVGELRKSGEAATPELLKEVDWIDDHIWVASSVGISYIDPASGELASISYVDPVSGERRPLQPSYAVERVPAQRAGNDIVLLGTDDGLYASNIEGLPAEFVKCIGCEVVPGAVRQIAAAVSPRGTDVAWIGSDKGLFFVRRVEQPGQRPEVSLDMNPMPGVDGSVRALLVSASSIWVGTSTGYYRIDPDNHEVTPLSGVPPGRLASRILWLSDRVWFLTESKGEAQSGKLFWEDNNALWEVPHLANLAVNSVEKVREEIWVGTTDGLFRWQTSGLYQVEGWPKPAALNDAEVIRGMNWLETQVWVSTNHRAYRGTPGSNGYYFQPLPELARGLMIRGCLDVQSVTWCWGDTGLYRHFALATLELEFDGEESAAADGPVLLPEYLKVTRLHLNLQEPRYQTRFPADPLSFQIAFSKEELAALAEKDCWSRVGETAIRLPSRSGTVYLRVRDRVKNVAELQQDFEQPGQLQQVKWPALLKVALWWLGGTALLVIGAYFSRSWWGRLGLELLLTVGGPFATFGGSLLEKPRLKRWALKPCLDFLYDRKQILSPASLAPFSVHLADFRRALDNAECAPVAFDVAKLGDLDPYPVLMTAASLPSTSGNGRTWLPVRIDYLPTKADKGLRESATARVKLMGRYGNRFSEALLASGGFVILAPGAAHKDAKFCEELFEAWMNDLNLVNSRLVLLFDGNLAEHHKSRFDVFPKDAPPTPR